MNLSLKTDVAATNRKLKEYQIANGMEVDKDLGPVPEPKTKPPKRKLDSTTDRSGLIKGLKKIEAPKTVATYDPFQSMPIATDYFTLSDDYETGYNEYKKNEAVIAGGYDFREALEESLVRAFSGFGVFIEEEKAQLKEAVPVMQAATIPASDDVF